MQKNNGGGIEAKSKRQKYLQLLILVIAAGVIYPMLYLRQNYQTSMEQVFHITPTQLGYLYSILGIFFFICYLPSGWLADRFLPRRLISFSLVGTGLLGIWYAQFPSFNYLLIIFSGWGITAGLTFWGALIKQVNLISSEDEQGRFYGALDGGRGLVEALLATIAVSVFAYINSHSSNNDVATGLRSVIYIYASTCIVVGLIVYLLKDQNAKIIKSANESESSNLWQNLKSIAAIKELWLIALIIFCGYQQFWATYLFSGYMQEGGFGLSAVSAGFIVAIKLWMRPIGGIGGGILGDKFSNISVLIFAMLISSVSLIGLSMVSALHSIYMIIFLVIFCGLLTYVIRGIYWAIFDLCHIPNHVKGLAIGIISIIAYTPDAFLPVISGYLSDKYPGLLGYRIFFMYIATMGLLGSSAALILKKRVTKRSIIK
ncbi:MAG: MFS transporter [Burkholderiales bacterium]|nr:MFS transporter [Burkholderiales bacterium]